MTARPKRVAVRSRKSTRAAASLSKDLMLAPAVVALRMPALMAEAGQLNPWRVETSRATSEKLAAAAEGMFAANLSLMGSMVRFWPEVFAGRTPSLISGAAFDRAMHAALKPSGGAVRGNFRRLSTRKS